MGQYIERLIRLVYKGWKSRHIKEEAHLDEEDIASFLDGRLSLEKCELIKEHLIACPGCAEALGLSLKANDLCDNPLPHPVLNSAREALGINIPSVVEIMLRLKERLLEVLKANGDVLVGQELVPASILRSRNLGDFKDEVVILKDFANIRVRVSVENKTGKDFNVNIQAKDKQKKAVIKDLRVTLFREGVELESYLNDSGSVTFEHLLLGKYKIEVADLEGSLASVLLEVKS
ncbi:MAG: hypothetical protein PHS12_06030 [Candidatus Omnitrophica bacterium]|nr:hypothetical protein [Candidatus Omnitrophota bacterium]MDD5665382.1 hypothetical protein [Candidatus Omnitrophota bacterium]